VRIVGVPFPAPVERFFPESRSHAETTVITPAELRKRTDRVLSFYRARGYILMRFKQYRSRDGEMILEFYCGRIRRIVIHHLTLTEKELRRRTGVRIGMIVNTYDLKERLARLQRPDGGVLTRARLVRGTRDAVLHLYPYRRSRLAGAVDVRGNSRLKHLARTELTLTSPLRLPVDVFLSLLTKGAADRLHQAHLAGGLGYPHSDDGTWTGIMGGVLNWRKTSSSFYRGEAAWVEIWRPIQPWSLALSLGGEAGYWPGREIWSAAIQARVETAYEKALSPLYKRRLAGGVSFPLYSPDPRITAEWTAVWVWRVLSLGAVRLQSRGRWNWRDRLGMGNVSFNDVFDQFADIEPERLLTRGASCLGGFGWTMVEGVLACDLDGGVRYYVPEGAQEGATSFPVNMSLRFRHEGINVTAGVRWRADRVSFWRAYAGVTLGL